MNRVRSVEEQNSNSKYDVKYNYLPTFPKAPMYFTKLSWKKLPPVPTMEVKKNLTKVSIGRIADGKNRILRTLCVPGNSSRTTRFNVEKIL